MFNSLSAFLIFLGIAIIEGLFFIISGYIIYLVDTELIYSWTEFLCIDIDEYLDDGILSNEGYFIDPLQLGS